MTELFKGLTRVTGVEERRDGWYVTLDHLTSIRTGTEKPAVTAGAWLLLTLAIPPVHEESTSKKLPPLAPSRY